MTAQMSELMEAGLLTGGSAPQLGDSGREWIHAPEDLEQGDLDLTEAAADLVLSTSGLYR